MSPKRIGTEIEQLPLTPLDSGDMVASVMAGRFILTAVLGRNSGRLFAGLQEPYIGWDGELEMGSTVFVTTFGGGRLTISRSALRGAVEQSDDIGPSERQRMSGLLVDVSRSHLRLHIPEDIDREFTKTIGVQDLGSTNGTYKIEGTREREQRRSDKPEVVRWKRR
jgi:hypothetical protein